MPREKNITKFLTTAVVFIVLEAAALALLKYNGPLQNMWVTQGAHALMGGLWGGTESVKHYFSLYKENEQLRKENEQLMMALQKYETDAENDVLAASDTIDRFQYIPAKIRKVSNNRQHNYLILNKGTEDGVHTMSGVITDKGVVGIVDAVSKHYCYARSFKNVEMDVSARIGTEGPVGILTWDGITSNGAILNGIPQHIHFSDGDTVFTSGYSDRFPPDIPLGTTGKSTIVNGAYYRIKVELFENPGSRRFATIVSNIDRDEIRQLEEAK